MNRFICRNSKVTQLLNHQKIGLWYFPRLSHSSADAQDKLRRSRRPLSATVLGLGGLIPFVGCTVGATVYMPEALYLLSETQSFYGASILSFLGGIQWGACFNSKGIDDSQTSLRLVASVIPSLAGFFSLLIPDLAIRLAIQVLSFLFTLSWDVSTSSRGWYPQWMIPLRYLLTGIVSLSLGVNSYLCWINKSK